VNLVQDVRLHPQCYDTVGWASEQHPACKKCEWWGAVVVICLQHSKVQKHTCC